MLYNEEIFGTFYGKDTVVCRQGEPGDTLYVIQSGAVEISRLQDGREVVLAILGPGDFFGEMALVDEKPRSATATTIGPTRLLALTRESFLARVRQDPGVVLHLLKALSRRIEETTKQLREKIEENEYLRLTLEPQDRIKRGGGLQNALSLDVENNPEALSRRSTSLDTLPFTPKETVAFDADEIIFRQGDAGDVLYLIYEGQAAVYQEDQGEKSFLARFSRGDIFGEMALFTRRPRTATAVAVTPCRLVPIPRTIFMEKVTQDPLLALYVLQVLILRLRRLNRALVDPEALAHMPQIRPLPPLHKDARTRIAFFSLSTCGGCPAGLLEDPKTLGDLLHRADVLYCPMLMDQREIKEADIAIVDGAMRMQEDVERILEVRRKNRFLVAWGTCAAFGGIPGLGNCFEIEEIVEESYGMTQDPFDYYLSGSTPAVSARFHIDATALLRRAGKLDDYVRVDYYLSGCPPGAGPLLSLLKELRGEPQGLKPTPIVCVECTRKPQKINVDTLRVLPQHDWDPALCFSSGASPCLGFLTKGGCGAVCPRNGSPCWGCRGPSEKVIKCIKSGDTFEEILVSALKKRCRHDEEAVKTVIKILRGSGHSLLNFSSNMILDPSRLR